MDVLSVETVDIDGSFRLYAVSGIMQKMCRCALM
jgi:hypothetical protein